ncbi:E3 ubiquitin-protein ligase MARCHF8 [Taenia solium]|eukprot:TsM_000277000 transcript=TsM_000277000 gene=TsM_000277000
MSRRTPNKQRAGSRRSVCASVTPLCRICYQSNEFTIDRDLDCRGRLIAPCFYKGSMKYVRQWRIQRWNEVSRSRKCERWEGNIHVAAEELASPLEPEAQLP